MKKGEATGPQKKPRRAETPEKLEKRRRAHAAAQTADPDAPLDPDAPFTKGSSAGDAARARAAWDSVLQRLSEEAQRVSLGLENYPAGENVEVPSELPHDVLMDIEAQLTKLRVQLEQTRDLVR